MSNLDTNPVSPASSSSRAPGGKLAGCYALTRRLEVGTGAEVWLAHDEVLGKDVSLHFAPEAIRKDSRGLQELRLDIKKNRQLIHPNILRVYDLVEEPDWVAISMDTFEGESLATQLGRQGGKPGDVGAIQPWAEQVARTLEEAHKINALHRDLSPSNIFLTPAGKTLVANFGISRSIREAQGRAGASVISPFTSPQLSEGKAPARTDDVYSLGAVLYNAVVGQAPSAEGGLSAEDRVALQSTSVPASWKATIAACLDRNPEGRPQTAAEVAKRWSSSAGDAAPAPAATPAVGAAPVPAAVPPVVVAAAAPAPAVAPIAAAAVTAAAVAAVPAVEAKSAEPVKRVEEVVAPAPEPTKREPASPVAEVPERVEEPAKPVAETPKRIEEPVKRVEEPIKRVEEPVKRVQEPEPAEPIKRVGEPMKRADEPIAAERKTAAEASKPAGETASKLPEPAKDSKKETAKSASSPSTQKSGERPPAKDFTPRMYPEESRFPVTGLAIAAVAIVVIAIIWHFATSGKPSPTVGPDHPAPSTPVNVTPGPEPSTPAIAAVTPKPARVTPGPSTPGPASMALAEKTAALEKARQDARAAEKAHEDLVNEQKAVEESLASAKKGLDEKVTASTAMRKSSVELTTRRKKLDDDRKAAETVALDAQKLAAEKARLSEESAKALQDFEKANADKLSAPQQVDAEIATLQKRVEEQQRSVDDAAKAVATAETMKKQQLAAVADQEREIERLKAAEAVSTTVKPETTPKPETTGTPTIDEMRLQYEKKLKELEEKLNAAGSRPPLPSTPTLVTPAPTTPAVTPKSTTPKGSKITPPATPLALAMTPPLSTPIKMDVVSIPPATPAVLATTPAPGPTVTTSGGNSLGMRFVPVGDVDFCIWQTRVKDFEIFAKAVSLRSTSWKGPGFKQGLDHPVVNVSWNEAVAFCKWLTDKEHKDNVLPANQFYRLPYDLEWSKAVGLPDETGKTAEMRDMGIPDVYPWGTAWPPPAGAGNYTGEETGSDVAIKGYDDGFPWTSPVGSFPPNKFGLYDMGGNVWQWCMDAWNVDSKAKVLRGASWYNGALKLSLLSSCRVHAAPDNGTDNYGFRIVRAKEEKERTRK